MDLYDLKQIASLAMDLGNKQNPDELEVYTSYNKSTNIQIRNGRIFSTQQSSDRGLGCRMAFGKKVSMGFTTNFAEDAVKKTVLETASTAKKSNEDEDWMGLPTDSGSPSKEKFFYSSLLETSTEELAEISSELLKNCRVEGVSDPIIPIMGETVIGASKSVIINSHGVKVVGESSIFFTFIGALAIAEGKLGPMSFDFFLSREKLVPDPSALAQKIAKEALELSKAKKVELPGTVPVIFHPFALNSIAQFIFLPAIRADVKQQGNSYLADRLGEEIVPEGFSIYDDGTLPQCTNSSHFDAEGTAKQRTVIFDEKGVFKNFLYDHTTATKDRTVSTGNATRSDDTGVNAGSYANSPSVAKTNWVVSPGKEDLDSLMSDIKLGLFIKDIQGAHQGSPESGDYTGVVNPGWIIRNGELAEPVVGFGLAGNILDLFSKFEGATSTQIVNSDALLPHVRFSEMRIVT